MPVLVGLLWLAGSVGLVSLAHVAGKKKAERERGKP